MNILGGTVSSVYGSSKERQLMLVVQMLEIQGRISPIGDFFFVS